MADRLFRISDIAVKGVTQEMIAAVTAAKTAFDKSMVDQEEKISERSISTGERVAKGNALYDFTIDLADAGKSYWVNKNEAKHSNTVHFDNRAAPAQGHSWRARRRVAMAHYPQSNR